MPSERTISADVVIVGAECTGITAAITAAKNSDLRIALITKGESIGRSGATMLACEPLSSCVLDSKSANEVLGLKLGDPRDSPQAFFEDLVTYGDFVNDQRLVDVVVSRAPYAARELRDWGFAWNNDVVDRSPGHRFPRDYYGQKAWGPQFLKLGASLLRKRQNVEVFHETMALDLVVSNGRISGLTSVDLKTGEFVVFVCRAVILATGGAQNVYSHVTTGRELTGDGFAMAYRSGAELMDMEFVKFYTIIVWPEGAGHDPSALLQAFRHTSHWYNRLGQRFMEKWNPSRTDGDGDGWNSVSKIAIATEILEGRGGKYGIYYSIGHLPKNVVDFEAEWGHLKGWKAESTQYDYGPYVEAMKEGMALEMTLAAHYNEGGVVVDEGCQSSIRGLFAAGEAAAGVDGGQRVAGMALTTAFVHGMVAAEACLRYLEKAQRELPAMDEVERLRRAALSVLRNREAGVAPIDLRKKIQSLADTTIWAVRSEASLKEGLEELPSLRKDLERMTLQNRELNYNPEFIEALQVRNLVDCFEMIAASSLARKESRGGHYRSDFPLTDNDNWLRNVVVRRGAGGAQVSTRPVVITRMQPPGGSFKHGKYFSEIDAFET